MVRIRVALDSDTYFRLLAIACAEQRPLADQAAAFIQQALPPVPTVTVVESTARPVADSRRMLGAGAVAFSGTKHPPRLVAGQTE